MSVNNITLIGRLTKDPELRFTAGNGIPVTNFTLAVDRPFVNQKGEREADFIKVVCWRKLAESCANNLNKGRLVGVVGRLQVRSYEAEDGQRRYISEVVADQVQFLDYPKDGNSNKEEKAPFNDAEPDFGVGFDIPDDIPF